MAMATFPTVDKCMSNGREKHMVVADMDGTLLRGRSSFPYFALIAFEVGGILRLLFLLLVTPLAGLLYYFISESAGIQVLIFATFAGVRVSEIESVARAVLPKFYSSDLHPESWRVLGTEIATYKGKATGFVCLPGVLVGKKKADALKKAFGDVQPEIGLGDRHTDIPFMKLCKEGYMVPAEPEVEAVTNDKLPKPIIFHDGRLVLKPTPLMALLTLLWLPVGFFLACLRISAGALLPMPLVFYAFWALGVRVTVKGTPPPPPKKVHWPIRRPLHLLPPHPPRPNLPLHRPRPPHPRRHLLRLPPLRVHLPHQNRPPQPRPGEGRCHDQEASRRRRPGHLPGGHHVSGAVSPEILRSVRGADGRAGPGGDGE
ncbi:hypothetical protein L3X38_005433 [Prunus dulcis]|uniref:Glycerol-3-phosphate acyltransferase RAM2/GPAT1-8 HAD-like domain-containing protein n=1 Tax=Prunus dulcis TaxID=3755 RepID=A0AAD4ZQY4_PRUDU|nr:hypothetical protein L3X38_005433 [Prunus dulcis]